MTSEKQAEMYIRQRARRRLDGMPVGALVESYLSAMERRGEIVPGAARVVADFATDPDLYGKRPRPEPGKPSYPPLPTGFGAMANLLRAVAYLEWDGSKYLEPNHKPVEGERPLETTARRFGMSAREAKSFYERHATASAGLTGAALAGFVFNELLTVSGGAYLGIDQSRPALP